ncbi:hypothetical protein ACFSUJ_01555 [Streptomyces lusitanus]
MAVKPTVSSPAGATSSAATESYTVLPLQDSGTTSPASLPP